MAFDKYKDGAWQEPESTVARYENGAWIDCESVKRYKNGAWEEIWANVKTMTLGTNELTKGVLQIIDDGLTFQFIKIMDYLDGGFYGSQSGGGTITFYLDGKWTNPTISFDWEGGFIYKPYESTLWDRVSAGQISLYHRKTDGTAGTTKVVSPVGSTVSDASSVSNETGSYSGSLTGEYDRLGISVYVNSFSGDYYNSSMTMIIRNLLFDGKKIGWPENAEFDLQDWSS